MNYYELLEIQPTASDEVIKMAYKALVKKYHPDVYDGDPEYAKEMFQKVNEAYEILINPESRKNYDRENLSRENVHFDGRNEYGEISYPQKRYRHGVRRRIEIGVNCILNSRLLPTRLCSHTDNCTVQEGKLQLLVALF